MAKYYNKNNGPLNVGLKDGGSVLILAKSWIELSPEQEGSKDLIKGLLKGYLLRRESKPNPSQNLDVIVEVQNKEYKKDEVRQDAIDSNSESGIESSDKNESESFEGGKEKEIEKVSLESEDSVGKNTDAPKKKKRRKKIQL